MPPITPGVFPGSVVVPSALQSVSGDVESHRVLKSASHVWRTATSISVPSDIPGVSSDIFTGFENIRCFPGIPNSNVRLSIGPRHFFLLYDFERFFS